MLIDAQAPMYKFYNKPLICENKWQFFALPFAVLVPNFAQLGVSFSADP